MHIGIVAGEPSGDLLASHIMAGIKTYLGNVYFSGIGGPRMQAQGLDVWHPMGALSVFGHVDALKRIPSLLKIYLSVKQRWIKHPPALFLGIDAPDFNLRLELQLRRAGIPTAHLVSPSVWAWRYNRIHKIRRAVEHMLVLFPFEKDIYRKERIPVTYIGHPLANIIPLQPDRAAACARLKLDYDQRVLAILPGSRLSEIRNLSPQFLQTAQLLLKHDPKLQCIVPMVNKELKNAFLSILKRYPVRGLQCIINEDNDTDSGASALPKSSQPISWTALAASTAVLAASGTATLEAALFKKPMVISYSLSFWVQRAMVWSSGQGRPSIPWIGLPNILLRDFVVPELVQKKSTPSLLSESVWIALTDKEKASQLKKRFLNLHNILKRNEAKLAANALLKLIKRTT